MMVHVVPDSTIIAAYPWSEPASRIAWKLGTNAAHIFRVWAKAKRAGILPPGDRPHGGFDQRKSALVEMMRAG